MSTNDILSQDEIDALLHGVDSGDVGGEAEEALADGEASSYDFTSQDRIVRGRLPTLEMIHERFARQFRISLFNMLRRSPEISVGTVQMVKFAEYVQGLFMPAHMNMVKLNPLRGTSLFTFDPNLIFSIVDNFFGGSGRFHTKIEGRDFTPTERRVVEMVLASIFADLKEAWAPVMTVDFEHTGTEVNPNFANIVSPSEVVVVTVFHIELEGGGGDFHVALPYAMVEPIRELLDAGMQSDRADQDDRWVLALREEVESANVELVSNLTETVMTLRQIQDLKPGDIIPIEVPDTILATSGGVPIFRARFGVSRGNLALKVASAISMKNRGVGLPL